MATRPQDSRGILAIQARMGSKRLPGKVLEPLGERPLLGQLWDRTQVLEPYLERFVLTSDQPPDQPLRDWLGQEGIPFRAGSEADVASRYRDLGREFPDRPLIRVSGDSPWISPALILTVFRLAQATRLDLYSNVHPRSFPKGQSVEVLAPALLDEHLEDFGPEDREHVTRAFYLHPGRVRIGNFSLGMDLEALQLSVDTPEDLARAKKLAPQLSLPGPLESILGGEEALPGVSRELLERARCEVLEVVSLAYPEALPPRPKVEIEAKLRVGILGLGVGEQHIHGYEAAGARVLALADIDPEKLSQVGSRWPGKTLTRDPQEVLKDPELDVISVASYDAAHADQVEAALQSGKHVFVEKPLCQTQAEFDRLWRVHRENPELALSSNLILRRSPRFRDLKHRIEAGLLGELYCLEGDYSYGRVEKITQGWRGKDGSFYSVMLGGGIHLIDLILWMVPSAVQEVHAFGTQIATRGTRFQNPDCVLASLRFQSGVLAKVNANFPSVHPHFHPFRAYGTQASFTHDLESARYFLSRNSPGIRVDSPYPGVRKGDLIESFIAEIQGQGQSEVQAPEVFHAMAVGLAIEASLHRGERVSVHYPSGWKAPSQGAEPPPSPRRE